MKSSKAATFAAMRQYIDQSTGRIDEEYLNRILQINLDNVEPLYNEMMNTRRKAHVVAWAALEQEANGRISFEFDESEPMTATSEHLKDWLNKYGRGYETIAETVKYIEDERKEN